MKRSYRFAVAARWWLAVLVVAFALAAPATALAGDGDIYENDDVSEFASELGVNGVIQEHYFDPEGDEDWAMVWVEEGTDYVFETRASQSYPDWPDTDTVLQLFDSDAETELDYNDDWEDEDSENLYSKIFWTANETKWVYLRVVEYDGQYGAYALRASRAPKPMEISDTIDPYYETVADFEMTALDETYGIAYLGWTIDNGEPQYAFGGETYSVNAKEQVTGLGPHIVTYWAENNMGEFDTRTVWLEIRDTLAPELYDDAVASYDDTATINLSPVDAGSGVASILYSLDGGPWSSSDSSTHTLVIDEVGEHTLSWCAVDNNGNWAEPKLVYFSVMDTIIPTVSGGPLDDYDNFASFDITGEDNGSGSGIASVSYILDGFAFRGFVEPVVTPGDLVNVQVGTYGWHRIEYWTTDNVGNESEHVYREFNVDDTIGPDVGYDGAYSIDANSTTLSFTAKDNEGGSGVDYLIYSIEHGVWHDVIDGQVPLVGLGWHNVRVWARDVRGNWGVAWDDDILLTDETAPGTSDDAASPYNDSATINMSAWDDNSGVAFIEYRLDGGEWVQTSGTSAAMTCETYGDHTLEYYAEDDYGNESDIVSRDFFVDDTVAPTASDDLASPYSDEALLTIKATDNTGGSGIDSITYSVGKDEEVTVEDDEVQLPFAAMGTYLVNYRTTDNEGNESEAYQAEVVVNDTIAPTISFSPDAGSYDTGSLEVSFEATDNAGGSGMRWVGWYSTTAGGIHWTEATETSFTLSGLGVHSQLLYAVDWAGNMGIYPWWVNYELVDQTAPTVSDDVESPYNDSATIKVEAQDSNSGVYRVRYRVDGGEWVDTYDETATVEVKSYGEHTLEYYAEDNEGNESDTQSVEFFVDDTTKPTASDDYAGPYDNSGSFGIAGVDAENGSGIASMHYTVDGGDEVTVEGDEATVAIDTFGDHEVLYWTTDKEGNESDHESLTCVIDDTIKPVVNLSLPDNLDTKSITVELAGSDVKGSGIETLYWRVDGEPVGYSNHEGDSITFTVSGLGRHTVEFSGVDKSGNSADLASTTFTMVDLTSPQIYDDAQAQYANSASIELWATDGNSGVAGIEYVLDGGEPVLVESDSTNVFTDVLGDHTLSFKATDGQGNDSITRTVNFSVYSTELALRPRATAAEYNTAFDVLATTGGPVDPSWLRLEWSKDGITWNDMGAFEDKKDDGDFRKAIKLTATTRLRARMTPPFEPKMDAQRIDIVSNEVTISVKAALYVPHAPTTVTHGKNFTAYGYLKPLHKSGTYPVRIYRWRLVGDTWKPYGWVNAKVSNYSATTSKYSRSFSLPYKGTWRLRAYHVADTDHAGTWSRSGTKYYEYVNVK